MTSLSWFNGFLKKQKGKMIVGLMIITVVSAMAVINPKVSGYVVDKVILN